MKIVYFPQNISLHFSRIDTYLEFEFCFGKIRQAKETSLTDQQMSI